MSMKKILMVFMILSLMIFAIGFSQLAGIPRNETLIANSKK